MKKIFTVFTALILTLCMLVAFGGQCTFALDEPSADVSAPDTQGSPDVGTQITQDFEDVEVPNVLTKIKPITWYCYTKEDCTLYRSRKGKSKKGKVAADTRLACIGKYPTTVKKFSDPIRVKVKLPGGKKGWINYSDIKDGVKANVNVESDYTRKTLERYVNKKKYKSRTGYLIVISPYTQRLYVFRGSRGRWQLERRCRVTTGRFSNPTKAGRTYLKSHIPVVWRVGQHGESYCFKNASFFTKGDSFHSGTFWPDGSIRQIVAADGQPGTYGCVRMSEASSAEIYKIPLKTAVIILK